MNSSPILSTRTSLITTVAIIIMAGCGPGYVPLCDQGRWPNASESGVQAELGKGTDVNAPIRIWGDYHTSPLHLAAECNSDPATVELLLINGANVHAKDPADQNTPLYYATRHHEHSNAAVVALLLEHGADPNAKAYAEVHGERPDGYEMISTSILYSASSHYGDPHVVRLLLMYGADPNVKNGNSQWGGIREKTPLHGAVNSSVISNPEVASRVEKIIRLLLEYGVDIDVRDDNGRTPCHYVTNRNGPDQIQDLLCK